MREVIRIFGNKKMIVFLIVVMAINTLVFLKEQYNTNSELASYYDKSIREIYIDYNQILEQYRGLNGNQAMEKFQMEYKGDNTSEYEEVLSSWLNEQIQYLQSYPKYQEGIQEQANRLEQISIFAARDTFSNRNIKKTADDFKEMKEIRVEVGNDKAILSFLSFELVDFLVLITLIVIVYQMLEERKKGLWDIVHCTKFGRFRLAVKRLLIILASSVTVCILMYGINLLVSIIIYGGVDDFQRCIQSIEIFKKYNISLSIEQFLIQFIMIKIMGSFFVSLCIWLVLSAIQNLTLGLLFMGGIIAIEYAFFTYLPVQSILNIFKYINLFSYINVTEVYIHYLNVSFLGMIMDIRSAVLRLLPVLIIVSSSLCIWINIKKKPKESSTILYIIYEGVQKLNNFVLCRLRLFSMELYKNLVMHKGFIVLLLLLYLQLDGVTNLSIYYSKSELYLNNYYEQIKGPFTEKTAERVKEIEKELDLELEELANLDEALSNKRITFEEYSAKSRKYTSLSDKYQAYEMLQDKVDYATKIKDELGIDIWIFNTIGYERLFGEANYGTQMMQACKAVFFLIVILCSIFIYEKTSGMLYLIRANKLGRTEIFNKKVRVTFLLTSTIWVMVYGVELINMYLIHGIEALQAPIQSVNCLSNLPYSISIGMFIVIIYGLKLICLQSVAYMILLISTVTKKLEYSILISIILILLPSILYAIGIGPFSWVAMSVPIAGVEWILGRTSFLIQTIPFIALITVGRLSRYMNKKIWNNEVILGNWIHFISKLYTRLGNFVQDRH